MQTESPEGRRKGRREREREARIASILEAASELFATKGVEATTMEEVAGLAELGKASLYHYFPTKQALFQEIVRAATRDLWETLLLRGVATPSDGDEAALPGSALDAIELLARFASTYFADDSALPRLLLPLMAGGHHRLGEELGAEVAAEVMRAHAPIIAPLRVVDDALGARGQATELLSTFLVGLALRGQADPDHDPGPQLDLFFSLLRAACATHER